MTPLRTSHGSSGFCQIELVLVVEERDRAVVAQLAAARRRAWRSFRKSVSWPGARDVTTGWPSSHSRIVSHQPADDSTLRAFELLVVLQHDARHAAVLDGQPLHAAAQLQLAAQRAKLPHEVLEDQPHARCGRPSPSRKMLRNMIENWPQSMSCSRAEP